MANDGFERTKKLLEKYPEFRDSDNKLMAHIWREDLGYKFNIMSAHEFLTALATSETLSKWGAITRYSRKVQELFPELQGKKYKERKEKCDDVISEMKAIESNFDKQFGFKRETKKDDDLF